MDNSPPHKESQEGQLDGANGANRFRSQKAYYNESIQDDAWQGHRQSAHQKKRKAKRKNDSLLAVISQWVVEHQVGMFKTILKQSRLTQRRPRACH